MKKPKNRKAAAKPAKAEPAKKRGRPPGKAAKAEKQAAAAKAAVGHNASDPKLRAIFLDHLPKVERLRKRVASVTGELRALYKDALKDGFTKQQFDVALQIADPEGEAKFKESIRKQLEAATFISSAYAVQLDMFGQPDRQPAADRAYDEGQKASIENKAALPPYDPSTEQYRQYMKGFHDHQETLAKGIKPKAEAKPAKADKPAKVPPAAPPPAAAGVTSGVAVTRSQLKAMQAAQAAKGEHVGEAEVGDDDDDGGFARREPAAAAG